MQTRTEQEKKLEEKRQKNFEESRFDSTKKRWGLFSFPGSLAISENSVAKKPVRQNNEDGGVAIGPRNFYSGVGKRGKTADTTFGRPTFTSIGDKFHNPDYHTKSYRVARERKARSVHDGAAFKQAGPVKYPHLPYPYMPQDVEKPKRARGEQGEVVIAPRNFTTSPAKKGRPNCYPKTAFTAHPEYICDNYNRRKEMESTAWKKSKESMPHETAFKAMHHGQKPFNSDREIVGTEVKPGPEKRERPTKPFVEHEKPFYPSKPPKTANADKTIGRFPEYMEQKEAGCKKRQPKVEDPPPKWRHTYNAVTDPTPSVVRMRRNIK